MHRISLGATCAFVAALAGGCAHDPRVSNGVSMGHTAAREWNEALLFAIRNDFARPTIHARNLYHTSAAMWDAWAAYDDTAAQVIHQERASADDVNAAREEALSYAAFHILRHRFKKSPGSGESQRTFRATMDALGYDRGFDSTEGDSPAALGNRIAASVIEFGINDGSNEQRGYANRFYRSANPPILPEFPGNPYKINPNRWQAVMLDLFIDQSGNVRLAGTPPHLTPEWGLVKPFSLTPDDRRIYTDQKGNEFWVYLDPGPPPLLNEDERDLYRLTFVDVIKCSSYLDPTTPGLGGEIIDISPASRGNNTLGTNDGQGRSVNPKTGQPYTPQRVPAGDYFRVLSEFWADGPHSETPPGHWFTIANYVADQPGFEKRIGGQGEVVDDLEWDVKVYLALGGAMHDAAISAWGIKGWYDYTRPICAIRYMAGMGQCTDPELPSYSPEGICLVPGLVELVTEETIQPGERHEHLAGRGNANVGKIAVFAWRGPNYIRNPNVDVAGVGWILAQDWWPYQRPTFVTPPFAGYISGHSTFSRAASTMMTLLTGDEFFPGGMGKFDAPKNKFLVFEDGPSVDVELQWATYYDAADETSISRIYGGIHPSADDIPGRLIGAKIGAQAFELATRIYEGAGSAITRAAD